MASPRVQTELARLCDFNGQGSKDLSANLLVKTERAPPSGSRARKSPRDCAPPPRFEAKPASCLGEAGKPTQRAIEEAAVSAKPVVSAKPAGEKRKSAGRPKGSAKKTKDRGTQLVVAVGETLVVLHEEDHQFRKGQVVSGNKNGHKIKFDDGAEEQINLTQATWRSQIDIEANVSHCECKSLS